MTTSYLTGYHPYDTNLPKLNRPLQVGDCIFHVSWCSGADFGYYEITGIDDSGIDALGRTPWNKPGKQNRFFLGSFNPLDEWHLIKSGDPTKRISGFSQFISKNNL